MAQSWKGCVGETLPWVRIPPSPPSIYNLGMPILALVLAVVAILLLSASFLIAAGLVFAARNRVPYVVTPPGALDEIVRALDVSAGTKVVDLGCGDGRVLAAVHRSEPAAITIGVENNPVIRMYARMRVPQAKIGAQDIAAVDLSDIDRIYTYLGPDDMRRLENKLVHELRAGTRLVTMQFPLEDRKPDKTLRLAQGRPHAATLYIYDF